MSAMRRINRAGQSWPQPRHDPKPRFRIKVARLRATSARMNPAHRIGFKESTNEIAKTALLPVAVAVKARVLVCRRGVGFVRALRLGESSPRRCARAKAARPSRSSGLRPRTGSWDESSSSTPRPSRASRRPKNAPRSTAPSPPARRVANPGTLARSRGQAGGRGSWRRSTRRKPSHRAKPDEPTKQHVEFQPFDQLPLGADRIEKLQQRSPQQALRRDGRTSGRLVKRGKLPVERGQRRIGQSPHLPQRMFRADPGLDVDVREQRPARPILAPHPIPRESTSRRKGIMR